jgi:AraC-like DNA-binding protein
MLEVTRGPPFPVLCECLPNGRFGSGIDSPRCPLALKLARDATGAALVPDHVSFAHAQPEDTIEHRRFFRGPVRFAAGSNAMVLSSTDAARPLLDADAALCEIVRKRLDKVVTDRTLPTLDSLTAGVRRILVETLGQNTMSADRVAGALEISRRTLTRRLAEEGTSFRAVLDDVRRELALALLQDVSLSIADVAFFLQYSEPAAFHRSFRRWTGLTPHEYRSRETPVSAR